MMRCLVDGRPATTLPVDDRGLQYGDGLFETLAVQAGRVAFLERHLARLAAGCERLGFPAVDRALLRDDVHALAHRQQAGVIKLILTRGGGRRGYAGDPDAEARRIVCLSDYPQWPDAPASRGIRTHGCSLRLASQPRLAGLKHLNRLEQVLARGEWRDEAVREGLLYDTRERLIEGVMSNVFIVSDGVLRTPRLDQCGVAGVMRSVIIDLAGKAGIALEIGAVSRQDARQADELFVCNSLAGIWPVVEAGGLGRYPVGDMTRRLQALLRDYDEPDNNNWYAS